MFNWLYMQRAQTEAVTFLGNQDSSRSLYAIPGLDYVSHEDILPYTTTEKLPLQHELFDKFLMYYPEKDPPFGAQETLRAWQKKNHPWLELSDVHKETTENVRVTVIPFYMGCRESQAASVFWSCTETFGPSLDDHRSEHGSPWFIIGYHCFELLNESAPVVIS
uniref:Uncharacterized protein n=1 Tax=Timema poppense TaxID=170557 RepID=A0A7R9HEF9_TIMPO|nr:unnamed protein product [Timema poppensis]